MTYEKRGTVRVATDQSMANQLRKTGSRTQDATIELIQPVVAANPNVTAAASAAALTAVNQIIADKSIVEAEEISGPGTDYAIAIPFSDGSRNALEVDNRGRPTSLSAALHVEVESPLMGTALGFETRTDVVADPNVRVIFAFETDEIAGEMYADGTSSLGGGGSAPASLWPAFGVGDSTTWGADLANPTAERWATRFQESTGHAVTVRARPGARMGEIAWFGGGTVISGAVTGASVPSGGEVTITGLTVDPWRAGETDAIPVIALTDAGVVLEGTLRSTNGNRVFTRTSSGGTVTTARLSFRATHGRSKGLMFLGGGVNDEAWFTPGGEGKTVEYALNSVKAAYRAATSRHEGPMVVWGLLDRGVNEAPGTQTGDYIAALELWLAQQYGNDFLNIRAYLASPQALTDALIFDSSFAPTSADTAAQNAGTVPPSFRTQNGGSVHLNALANRLQARLFVRHLTLRGLL